MASISFPSFCNWMKFKHLVLIDSLGKTQNMHLTAQYMNLSQPAVSKMLKEIEGLLGFDIFERHPRSMPATDLGKYVIHFANKILNESESFVDQVTNLRDGGYGYLKVGGIFAATSAALPNAILEIKQRYPLLNIEVVEQTSGNLIKMLEDRTLDLAVGRFSNQSQLPSFDYTPLAPENFCLVVNSKHPLSKKKETSLEDLFEWPWLMYPEGTPIRTRMEESFNKAGVSLPKNTVVTISVQTFLELLQRGPMIGMLPTVMVRSHLENGTLSILKTPLELIPQYYGILTRKNEGLVGPTLEFKNILQKNAIQVPPHFQ